MSAATAAGVLAGWPGMPDVGWQAVALLVLAALVAGWVDAVVGGGGLVQLPALLLALPGATPVQVLATNKLSGVWGTTAAAVTYARRLPRRPRAVGVLTAAAAVGSGLGAALAALVPPGLFTPLVLVLVVVIGVVTVARPRLGLVERHRVRSMSFAALLAGIGIGVGVWDGIFGPGTGTLFVFALVGLAGYQFLDATGLARIANAVTNLAALVVFTLQGAPLWTLGVLMGAANLAGGWLGAHTAIARGSAFVRAVFLVVVGLLAARLAWDVVAGL
ncbi:TSUP family transporter [Aquipuribacter nitratireducens]|uniref:Probable membrane transporter protein n=1 Tax=Aquipuribacter nitratireducens TaxID=650104 RepID=A0ABW0GLE6_9MICO